MTVHPDEFVTIRVPTPADMALIVKAFREKRKWTQETLAEVAGVTQRTIQRIETGTPSNLDTRRAIARAFEFDDIDFFERPLPFPDPDKLRTHKEEIERTTVEVSLARIEHGRALREMTSGVLSSVTDEVGEPSEGARKAFAELVDYLRDYNDVRDAYSATERLAVDADIDALLRTISEEHAAVGAGLRSAKVRLKTDQPDRAPMEWKNVYLVLAPASTLPSAVRVPKHFKPM
jgi:transcriptional regulator with XRE-family HTH domain